MKKIAILISALLLTCVCCAQQGYIHGSGAPTASTNCGASRFYIDDSTGQMWLSTVGSPCGWMNPGPGMAGVTDASSAPAGYVGEVISSKVAIGSAVSLTTATAANVTSITLTAGDWDICGNVNYVAGSATIAAGAAHEVGISGTTATLPTDGTELYLGAPILTTTSAKFGAVAEVKTMSVSAGTVVYLVATGTFTAGTETAYGTLTARRRR